jgi:hypothetical protein
MIRADGCRPRQIGEGVQTAREISASAGFGRRCAANHVRLLRMHGIHNSRTRFLIKAKPVYPKIVDCARMASSSVHKR